VELRVVSGVRVREVGEMGRRARACRRVDVGWRGVRVVRWGGRRVVGKEAFALRVGVRWEGAIRMPRGERGRLRGGKGPEVDARLGRTRASRIGRYSRTSPDHPSIEIASIIVKGILRRLIVAVVRYGAGQVGSGRGRRELVDGTDGDVKVWFRLVGREVPVTVSAKEAGPRCNGSVADGLAFVLRAEEVDGAGGKG
jgi:hypothetical protein